MSSVQDLNNPAGVITSKRSLDTTVLVDDKQTLVLAGLIQDQVTQSEFKVPLLGDIPLLGWFFRYETRKNSKTNLMIFIRPTILRTAEASKGFTQDRYENLRGQQEHGQLPWNLILPSMPAPLSPEIPATPIAAAEQPANKPISAGSIDDAAQKIDETETEIKTEPVPEKP